MKICVLGLGYIGLPTAVMMARHAAVVGYDVQPNVIESLRAGTATVKEPGVGELVKEALKRGSLILSSEVPADAQAYVICVPTPILDGRPDLSSVIHATQITAAKLSPGDIFVIESTVPPGTMDHLVVPMLRGLGVDPDLITIAHCPERVTPGDLLKELRENDRVIGGRNAGDAERARVLYAPFCTGQILTTDNTTAELSKVIENSYRHVNIAFANELALLAEDLGVDAQEVIALANRHPRVNILQPGPGVGGHCIPVDPRFLSDMSPFRTELIQTASRVNERMPLVIVERIEKLSPLRAGSKIAILGATYKANVDDIRESPTMHVDAALRERGYETLVFDPLVGRHSRVLASSVEDAVRGADAIVLMVGHDAFSGIDPVAVGSLLRTKLLVDTRAFFPRAAWIAAGFQAYTLGNGS